MDTMLPFKLPEIDGPFKTTISGVVTDDTLKEEIFTTVSRSNYQAAANVYYYFPEWYAAGPNAPRLHKRIANWLHSVYDIDLAPDVLKEIADIVAKAKDRTYSYDVTTVLDWAAGTYGEDDSSCWWDPGQYLQARTRLLPAHQGGAIRTYRNGEPNGRAWVMPLTHCGIYIGPWDSPPRYQEPGDDRFDAADPTTWAVFNGYGYGTPTMAE